MGGLLQIECGLPQRWLPDETLFSLCSRYHMASGNHLASTTCKLLFGHPTQGSAHDFPARLNHFLAVAGSNLGSADEIGETRTVLPIYLRFATPELAELVRRASAEASSGALKFQLGLLTSRFRANHPLKACRACMINDAQAHATAYWHWSHQLPGVWVCLHHRHWLVASDLKATGVRRFHWILPFQAQFPPGDDSVPPDQAFALAKMVIGLATRGLLTLDPQALTRTYRQALGAQGLLSGSGHRLRRYEAGQQYADFLQPLPRLEQLGGLPRSSEAAAGEIARLVGPVRSGIHPLRHLMLATWLLGSIEEFLPLYEQASRQYEAYAAESSSTHSAPASKLVDERKHRFAVLLESGLSVSRASSEIGVDTNTGMAWAAGLGIATPRRPKLLVPEVRKTLIRLLTCGAAKDRAAAAGNVSVQTITNLLRSEVGLHEAWKAAQFESASRRCRRRWLRYITANPHSGVKAARLAEPAVYAWLYRNDRDWLKAQTFAMERVARSPHARVDWDQRDLQLSEQVRRVALELHEAEPDRRIKLFQIYQRLPELKAKLFKMDRLPLTRSAIHAVLGKS